ncbi:hypothetical protein BC830DRAFT_1128536 [Chytriomyces sp. MP71]|nr:hypothetical protein BC830DRAFT_1128536 [Chytriomyces sp. MP71]
MRFVFLALLVWSSTLFVSSLPIHARQAAGYSVNSSPVIYDSKADITAISYSPGIITSPVSAASPDILQRALADIKAGSTGLPAALANIGMANNPNLNSYPFYGLASALVASTDITPTDSLSIQNACDSVNTNAQVLADALQTGYPDVVPFGMQSAVASLKSLGLSNAEIGAIGAALAQAASQVSSAYNEFKDSYGNSNRSVAPVGPVETWQGPNYQSDSPQDELNNVGHSVLSGGPSSPRPGDSSPYRATIQRSTTLNSPTSSGGKSNNVGLLNKILTAGEHVAEGLVDKAPQIIADAIPIGLGAARVAAGDMTGIAGIVTGSMKEIGDMAPIVSNAVVEVASDGGATASQGIQSLGNIISNDAIPVVGQVAGALARNKDGNASAGETLHGIAQGLIAAAPLMGDIAGGNGAEVASTIGGIAKAVKAAAPIANAIAPFLADAVGSRR